MQQGAVNQWPGADGRSQSAVIGNRASPGGSIVYVEVAIGPVGCSIQGS